MNELLHQQPSGDVVSLEMGKILGHAWVYGTVAGRCSAAQAATIRKVRDSKVHEHFGLTWREFCPKHIGLSGSHADLIIRRLEEFGPDYFEHTQTVRISPDTYRLIAPHIHENALRLNDEVLELNSANVQKVAKSLRDSQPAAPGFFDRVAAFDRAIVTAMNQLQRITAEIPEDDKAFPLFREILIRTANELNYAGLQLGLVHNP